MYDRPRPPSQERGKRREGPSGGHNKDNSSGGGQVQQQQQQQQQQRGGETSRGSCLALPSAGKVLERARDSPRIARPADGMSGFGTHGRPNRRRMNRRPHVSGYGGRAVSRVPESGEERGAGGGAAACRTGGVGDQEGASSSTANRAEEERSLPPANLHDGLGTPVSWTPASYGERGCMVWRDRHYVGTLGVLHTRRYPNGDETRRSADDAEGSSSGASPSPPEDVFTVVTGRRLSVDLGGVSSCICICKFVWTAISGLIFG